MFGLGYQELLLILVIVLILFGAQRLPDLARSLGSSVKEFKKGVTELKDDPSPPQKKDDDKKVCPPRSPRRHPSRRDRPVPSDRYAVGIDLGGSKLRGGLVSPAGQLVGRVEVQTEAWKGAPGVMANLKGVISRLLDSTEPARVAGIGIAAAGQIHPKTHAVVYAPNLEWENVPLRDEIESAFGLPVYVENDVRAAAWGEYRFGVGRGVQSLIAVFVGTGVGSGAVVDGILLKGAGNAAGELGHTQVVPDGLPCACGRHGCVEAYASGRGFARRLEAAPP